MLNVETTSASLDLEREDLLSMNTRAQDPKIQNKQNNQKDQKASALQSTTQLNALTFLRFVAAIAIVVHHSIFSFNLPRAIEGMNLTLAVSFFFVLSGFILAYVHPKIAGLSGTLRFWQARMARCWPLHLATFTLFAFVFKYGNGYDENGVPRLDTSLQQILLVQAWNPDPKIFFSFNTPSWSVSVEYFFYFCFPFLQIWYSKGHRYLKIITSLVVSTLITVGCSIIASRAVEPTFKTWLVYINPFAHLFEFVVGILCASLYLRWQKGNSWLLATVFQLCTVALMAISFANMNSMILALPFCPSQIPFGLICGLLIIAFALHKGALSRLIDNGLAVKLGDVSFAIYMLHSLISSSLRPLWDLLKSAAPAWAFFAYIAVVLMLSFVSHQFFELPVRNWIMRFNRATISDARKN